MAHFTTRASFVRWEISRRSNCANVASMFAIASPLGVEVLTCTAPLMLASHHSEVSWDLDLLPAEHGDDAGVWLEEAAEDHDEAEARRHADLVCARRPELELGGPFEGTYQLTLPEDSGLPLDVGLYGSHASISVAYWDLGDERTTLRMSSWRSWKL